MGMGDIVSEDRGMITALIIALIVFIICAGLYVVVDEFRIKEQRKFIEAQGEYIRSLEHKINRG